MNFWDAYRVLREEHCLRAEEVAVGAEISVWTVMKWDRCAKDPKDDHGRNPSFHNRVRLARLAESKGARTEVVEALKPDDSSGGDTARAG